MRIFVRGTSGNMIPGRRRERCGRGRERRGRSGVGHERRYARRAARLLIARRAVQALERRLGARPGWRGA